MKKAKLFMMLALLVMGVSNLFAQNVKISPSSGNLVAALTTGSEDGFEDGFCSMWRHEQLALSFTISDFCNLTSGGELLQPAGNLTAVGNNLVVVGGTRPDAYMCLSLPKGYRFTGYRIVLANNLVNEDVNDSRLRNTGNKIFYETSDLSHESTNLPSSTEMDYDLINDVSHYNTIKSEINAGNPIYLAVARNSKEIFEMAGSIENDNYVIERTSINDDDMDNHLYFRIAHSSGGNNSGLYGLTIVSFEVFFTAEGTFEADVAPSVKGPARSFVTSPFKTSKIDVGAIEQREKNNKTFYAYSYENVQDLDGNIYIYQSDAVDTDGEPKEGVAQTKKIYPLEIDGKNAFAFGNGTYYVEPPVSVATSSGQTAPIGYRVVGAVFNYLWETGTTAGSYEVHGLFIKYTNEGKTYYLDNNMHFVTEPYEWILDEENYIKTNDGKKYLACYGDHDDRDVQLADLKTYALRRDANGHVYYISSSRTYYYLQWYNGTHLQTYGYDDDYHLYYNANYSANWKKECYYNWDNPSITPKVVKSTNVYDGENPTSFEVITGRTGFGPFASYTYGTITGYGCYRADYLCVSEMDNQTINYPAYTPGAYTLKVYDKTGTKTATGIDENGKKMSGEIEVKEKSDAGHTFDMGRCNNDAIKFEISGLGVDGSGLDSNGNPVQALVNVTLLLEALDPYIKSMNIVCHDPDNQLELAQNFTANDFRVAGGKFNFYIPEDYASTPLTFTFSDLYSDYGDETYYTNTPLQLDRNARYNFVTSEYHESNKDLYNPNGNIDDYTRKVVAAKAGNIRFKFNNAEDLTNTDKNKTKEYLRETQFSYNGYLKTTDPDVKEGQTAAQGNYIDCQLIANTQNQPEGQNLEKSGTYYVFVADEPRYNIAPGYTKKVDGKDVTEPHAWQHRYYAFYRMDIELIAKDYDPDLTWKELYDKTYYRVKKDNGEETKTHSMWGVDVKAKDGDKVVTGYLTVKQILKAINSDITGKKVASADGKRKLEGKDQILYIDGSNLYNILSTSKKEGTTTTKYSLADLKTDLGVNALVFLPERTTSTDDNFAKKSSDGVFYAGKDINITDKQPFFSPHDININYPNVAKYDRILTSEQNGQVCNASVVLPFDIDLDDEGYHDIEGGGRFYLAKLKDNQTLKKVVGNDNTTANAFFEKIIEKKGAANTPYVVKVENQNTDDTNISFKVRCVGSKIVATPYQYSEAGIKTNGIFTPWGSVKGYYGGDEYNFTPTGTFRGYTFENAGNASTKEQIFYFAKNSFYTSKTLRANEPMLVQPFRSYFDYTVNGTNSKLSRFFISFDDSDEFGGTNGINEIERDVDLAVIPGKGVITLVARADKDVTIHAVNGQTIDKCNLNAGESRTVAVPAGVYVINGVKMVVK